jgi:adenine-specific DNA-methyltransferase
MVALQELTKIRRKRISSVETAHKERYAQYLTPVEIARYMAQITAGFCDSQKQTTILDAGAGSGILSCCLVNELLQKNKSLAVNLDAYELDPTIFNDLDRSYRRLADGSNVRYSILQKDFITGTAFDIAWGINKKYGLIILNPPYKKIHSDSEYRRAIRDIGIETVNTYSAFIAIAIKLLADNGILTAIVPRSFCNGLYFRPFRKFMLENTTILHIHAFEKRNNLFADENVLQENIIITLKKTQEKTPDAVVSYSKDKLFTSYTEKRVPYSNIVDPFDEQQYIAIPDFRETHMLQLSCLHSDLLFDVSTGPIVDFRAKENLIYDNPKQGIPLLYAVHIRNQRITWPVQSKKPNSILLDEEGIRKNAFRQGYYVLVKRFSAKEERRRIYATLLRPEDLNSEYFTVENHINIIHWKHGSLNKDIAEGLAAYLNTTHCDLQFRSFSGHTQVNATDLRNMKYPSPDTLIAFGKLVQGKMPDEYDLIFEELQKYAG